MDLKTFKLGISQLAEEKGISEEKVKEIIETAMAAAYKKDYGERGQKVVAELDFQTGEIKFWQLKQIVDESMILSEEEIAALEAEASLDRPRMEEEETEEEKKVRFNPERHVMIEEARKDNPDVQLADELRIPLAPKEDYGRIAAQTAKQVILQKLKESEREMLFAECKEREDQIISGTVQRIGMKDIFFDIGKTLGILTKEEQIPGEFYKIGQRFRLYVLKVEDSPKGPQVFLSRVFPKFISKLFEVEVPEIASGQVEIKSIAREPGSRTKVAVWSNSEDIDPIGSAIGQRGTRVLAIISELGGEKIDIIEYSDDPERYVANAVSPAKAVRVKILPKNRAICVVPEDQLSLAIGKEGQNVRLAAKLTGWKIDIRSTKDEEAAEEKEEAEKEAEKEGEEKKEEEEATGIEAGKEKEEERVSGVEEIKEEKEEGTEKKKATKKRVPRKKESEKKTKVKEEKEENGDEN